MCVGFVTRLDIEMRPFLTSIQLGLSWANSELRFDRVWGAILWSSRELR